MVAPRAWAVACSAAILAGTWTLSAAPAGRPAAQTSTPSAEAGCAARVPWDALRFEASKFFLSATATMTVQQVPAGEADGELKAAPEGQPLRVPAPCIAELTVTTRMPFGRGEDVTVWFDPGSGAAQQYEKVASGGSPYRKIGRYTRDGYFLWRSSPADARQVSLAPAEWTHHKTRYESWGDELPAGAVVTDPYALLYLVSESSREGPGEGMHSYVFADGHLVELRFTDGGTTTTHVDFKERGEAGSRRQRGPTRARVVRVSASAPGEGAGKVDLGFLGMRGALKVLIAADSGIPLAVQGDVEHLGELTARLQEVRLRGRTPG